MSAGTRGSDGDAVRPLPLAPVRRRADRVPPRAGGRPPQRHEPAFSTSLALRDLCRAVADAESALARRLGLRAGDYRAVKLVLYAASPLGVSELADRLGLSKGTTSELVDRLEARELVTRERDPRDGRRVVLRARPLALSQVHEDLGALFGALADVARTRDPATLRGIADFLRDAVDAVDASAPGPDGDRAGGAVSA